IKNKGLDLLQPIATRLFDTFNVGFGKLTDLVLALPPLDQIFGPAVVAGGQIFAGIMSVLAPAFQTVWTALQPLIPSLVELWTTASPIMVVFAALQPLLPQIASLFSTLAGIIGGALAAILPTIVELITTLAGVFSSALAV